MAGDLKSKLASLPTTPGVYSYKDSSGEIIYIGKAANLRTRVRQYFQKGRPQDTKTHVLVGEIADVSWIEVETEVDALFLEAEHVRRYQPRFNIMLRDDKSSSYVRIDYKSDYPTVTLVRRPMDDGARYFGPYLNSLAIKKALRFLRRAFPYATHRPVGQKRASLHYHLGLDPGLEDGRTSIDDYRADLKKLMQYLSGERVALVRNIEREMKKASKAKNFERAAALRNQLQALHELSRQVLFSDRELLDASRDEAMAKLTGLLGLARPPRRIECFDVSHMQGSDTVASMVVFINGVPDKTAYRKFKMRLPGNDDFAHISEATARRFREENRIKWALPDLVIVDGGKGQLSAGLNSRDSAELQSIPMIGLAKRKEEIIVHRTRSLPAVLPERILEAAHIQKALVGGSGEYIAIELPQNSALIKLLQRIRDESHRFAVTYHTTLKRGRVVSSILDEIPGIGPLTRKKLIRHFGSARAVVAAEKTELQNFLGSRKGEQLARYLESYK